MIPKCKKIEKKCNQLAQEISNIEKEIKNIERYSTEEQEVGFWINNKTIYKKTIYINGLPNANTEFFTIFTEDSNIDKIWIDESASFILTEDENEQLPVNWYYSPSGASIMTSILNKNIRIITSDDKSKTKAYITVKYTKITD